MRTFSRRHLLAGAAAGSFAPLLKAKTDYTRHLGVQLYTLRDVLPKEPDQTLKAVAGIGYREVEVIGDSLDQLAPILKKYNLQPVSGHFPVALITGEWKNYGGKPPSPGYDWQAAVGDAKKHGLSYMVIPYLNPAERSEELFRSLVDKLNGAGEACKKAGMKLCYHNHAFEYAPRDGGNLLSMFMDRTDRNLVFLELDIFWASVAGHDPAQLMRRYSGRIPLIHLKDKAADTPQRYDESVPRTAFKEVGNGVLDIPGILKAATESGVQHFIVEQDQTTGDPIASLRQSYEYVKKLSA